jgi:hypothetical protein
VSVVGRIALLAGSIFIIECNALVAAAPSAIADVACVIADDVKGNSISQIILDCGGDTAQVIAILADPANHSKVNGTPAYAEVERVKTALAVKQ